MGGKEGQRQRTKTCRCDSLYASQTRCGRYSPFLKPFTLALLSVDVGDAVIIIFFSDALALALVMICLLVFLFIVQCIRYTRLKKRGKKEEQFMKPV